MKKRIFLVALLGIAIVAGLVLIQNAQAHGPRGWGGYGGWGCPMGGYGMGPGMMGRGYGPQYGPQYGPPYGEYQKPMGKSDAEGILKNHLDSLRNPNLKLGKIEDRGDVFEADIVTKDGSLVDRLLVDKNTGWVRSVY
ncbi:MAG: hypothetical protein JRH07_02375 [Deltaproteobacteria bacterium]|nr:hypothetical protein [Deltaproteobacteria bacterium]